MIFADIPRGSPVFLNTNTLIFHFIAHARFGAACTELVERMDRQEIQGFTSTHILGELAHRLMTIEAAQLFGWLFPGIVYRLQQHPAEVQQLTLFQRAVDEVLASTIPVLTIVPSLVSAAALISRSTGLLSNDALAVALMRANGLSSLASADSDFDRVPGLTRYAPA
jgi:predicted nucleic acid-binding protein